MEKMKPHAPVEERISLFFNTSNTHTDKTHGAPEDSIEQRMMGDLGNILVDETGKANVDLTIDKLTLLGPHSVLGRSMVIYAGEDDQGRGGHENSLINGNPGPRIAAGVIGLAL
jgi:superoxide dismutase, Cu-Zn family